MSPSSTFKKLEHILVCYIFWTWYIMFTVDRSLCCIWVNVLLLCSPQIHCWYWCSRSWCWSVHIASNSPLRFWKRSFLQTNVWICAVSAVQFLFALNYHQTRSCHRNIKWQIGGGCQTERFWCWSQRNCRTMWVLVLHQSVSKLDLNTPLCCN